MRKTIAFLLTLILALSLTVLPAGAEEGLFSDVAEDAWYAEAAAYCETAGLMEGMGDGTFDPRGVTTRAMVVTVLHRLSGSPAQTRAEAFPDVKEDSWYGTSVGWAAAQGIALGRSDGTFGPMDSVTRQDLAVFLWRSMGNPVAVETEAFADEAEISSYALEAVRWAKGAGLVNGMGDGSFAPRQGATRAQLANILMKLSKSLLGPSYLDGTAYPCGIAKGEEGILVTDTYNKCVWLIKDGASTRFAGMEPPEDATGAPVGGYVDAACDQSLFSQPWAIAPFLDGWAVADTKNNAIRLITKGSVQTVNASAGETGLTTGAMGVIYDRPMGLAADDAGNLYVADTGSGCIRIISSKGVVTTLAKDLAEPTGLVWADGSLYVAETENHRILKITDGTVTVLAGSGEEGYLDGAAETACFSSPMGLAVDAQGRVYVADAVNGAVRRIADGTVITLVKAQPDRPQKSPTFPVGLLVDGESLYVCDNFVGKLLCIPLA